MSQQLDRELDRAIEQAVAAERERLVGPRNGPAEKLELVRDVLNPSTGATDNKAALAECYLIVRRIVDPILQERGLDAAKGEK